MTRLLLLGALLMAAFATAQAQASLSAQGLGYPAGSLSARSLGLGGSNAELDAISPINPAALATVNRPIVFLQYGPEFRRVINGDAVDRSTIIRFPVIGAALPFGARSSASLTATTFADRTWGAIITGTEVLDGQPVQYTDRYRATGAINDIRLGGSYALTRTFALGLGAHVLTGENTLTVERAFEDTGFVSFGQRTVVGYTGPALSGGASWRPSRVVQVGASARIGGSMRAYAADSVIARGNVPPRFGAGVQYAGIEGTLIAARAGWEGWSEISGLVPGELGVQDTWEYAIGAETRGPVFLAAPLPLRVGLRVRDLPFAAPDPGAGSAGVALSERSFTFGTALALAPQRAIVDLSVQRSTRSGHSTVSERGWSLHVGLNVLP